MDPFGVEIWAALAAQRLAPWIKMKDPLSSRTDDTSITKWGRDAIVGVGARDAPQLIFACKRAPAWPARLQLMPCPLINDLPDDAAACAAADGELGAPVPGNLRSCVRCPAIVAARMLS